MQLRSAAVFLLLALASSPSSSSSSSAAATTEYPACTPQQSQQFFSSLSSELAQCKTTSTFDLTAGALPSVAQRAAVCKCTPLIKQLQYIKVPRCKLSLDGNAYKFKDAITSIFAQCSGVSATEEPPPATSQDGSKAVDDTAGGEADAPNATTAAPTPPVAVASTAGSDVGASQSAAGSVAADTSIEDLPSPSPTPEAVKTSAPSSPVPTPTPTSAARGLSAASTVVAAALAASAAVAVRS